MITVGDMVIYQTGISGTLASTDTRNVAVKTVDPEVAPTCRQAQGTVRWQIPLLESRSNVECNPLTKNDEGNGTG